MGSGEGGEFVELEFRLDDDAYPAVRISERLGCRLDLLDALQNEDGKTTAFFHVDGAEPDAVVEAGRASALGDDIGVVERFDGECAVEVVLSGSVFGTLADLGVPLQSLVVRDGAARATATVPPNRAAKAVIAAVNARHPDVELVGKRGTDVTHPFLTRTAFRTAVEDRLTDRQLDALRVAFEHGYFERPRRTSQRELAELMGISPSTFGQHLHRALRKLLGTVFADDHAATPLNEQ